MIRVGISGCNGNMGRVLGKIIEEIPDMEVILGVDHKNDISPFGYQIYVSPLKIDKKLDVVIDFSNPACTNDLLEYGIKSKTPIVIATTGLSEDNEIHILEASKHIPIFKSSNTSLGINLLLNLVKKATHVLGRDFDIEIIEKHHNKKVDSPSGTAYMIANAINSEYNDSMDYKYGREGKDTKRNKNEIGIHAVRGGTISGEHTVIFAGLDEVIEIKHSALSKNIFAKGAIDAARFIIDKKPMIYMMDNLIN